VITPDASAAGQLETIAIKALPIAPAKSNQKRISPRRFALITLGVKMRLMHPAATDVVE